MKKLALLSIVCIMAFLAIGVGESLYNGERLQPGELAFELAEAILIFGAVGLTAIIAYDARNKYLEQLHLVTKLEKAKFEGANWRRLAESYVNGLGAAISTQFEDWKFTPSESDIAMLMLKGFSHNEIASLRATSVATVRQQASMIYRKSGLTSRRELTAFFLEDLTPALDKTTMQKENIVRFDKP